MSMKFNATESLWYKGVATFSSGGETTDSSYQISVIMHGRSSAWWQLALPTSECLVRMVTLRMAEEQI